MRDSQNILVFHVSVSLPSVLLCGSSVYNAGVASVKRLLYPTPGKFDSQQCTVTEMPAEPPSLSIDMIATTRERLLLFVLIPVRAKR